MTADGGGDEDGDDDGPGRDAHLPPADDDEDEDDGNGDDGPGRDAHIPPADDEDEDEDEDDEEDGPGRDAHIPPAHDEDDEDDEDDGPGRDAHIPPADDEDDEDDGNGGEDAAASSATDGGAYGVDDVEPYSGPGATGGGATPGAPDDQEMPLADHIEEMVRRLAVVVVIGGLVAAVVFPFADRLITFLWFSFLPGSVEACPPPVTPDPASGQPASAGGEAACPYVYHPLALIFARLKVASLVGFIAAMPVVVYESYLFMRPGLYPRERRYYLASVPTSLVLAGVGVAFAHFLVLPTLFIYFTGYTDQAAEVAFGLSETFNLIVMMLGFFALVFQIPLLIMLAVMMGVTSRKWLADRRLYFYGGFATVAFLFSPDPTGMAPILVAVTMIALFEGTLLVLRWTLESSPIPSAAGLADRRPAVYLLALVAGYLASTAPLPGGYYASLPAAVREGLAALGLTRATPLLVGLGLVAGYELLAYLARRTGADVRVRRALSRGRILAWLFALVVGYFGSPDPVLVARVDALDFGLPRVAAVVVGLVALYELAVATLRWQER